MTTVAMNVIHTEMTITTVELLSPFCPEFPAFPPASPDLVVLTVFIPGRVVSEMDEVVSGFDTLVVAGEVSGFVGTWVEAGGGSVEERVVFLTRIVVFNVVLSMCVVCVVEGDVFGVVVGSVFVGVVVDVGKVVFEVFWEVDNAVDEDFGGEVEVVNLVVFGVVDNIVVIDDVLAEVCDVDEVV